MKTEGRCVIVSRTLISLDPKAASSASQLYELRLARALSNLTPVEVVALSGTESDSENQVRLTPLRARTTGVLASLRLLIYISRSVPRNSLVVAFGYSPLLLLVLWIVKFKHLGVFTIIFDNHKGALSSKRWIKKMLIDLYFNTGFKMIMLMTGIFVVTPKAGAIVTRRNPYVHITRIGATSEQINRWREPEVRDSFHLIFAGALEEYNSISEMIEACRLLNESETERIKYILTICGSGSLSPVAAEAALAQKEIQYLGLVPNSEVQERLSLSHLALNPRDMDSPITEFAFPSKLIDLLAAGIPIVSTPVMNAEILSKYARVIPANDPASIVKAVRDVAQQYNQFVKKAAPAKEFVGESFDSIKIAHEMLDFMSATASQRNESR